VAMAWDALGESVDQEMFRRLLIPLNRPSAFQTVVNNRAHYLGALQKNKTNIQFLKVMGKQIPSSVFIMPILVHERVMNLLYGDNGHRQHCSNDVGELLILAQRISHSYDQLINEKLARKSGIGSIPKNS